MTSPAPDPTPGPGAEPVPVWIAGRTYTARVPDTPQTLKELVTRLRQASTRTRGRVALGLLPDLFGPRQARDLFGRVDDPGDALDEAALYRALLETCRQVHTVMVRALATVRVQAVPRPGGRYVPVIGLGGHERELTAGQARDHAAAVMAVAVRAEHDQRLLHHLVHRQHLDPHGAVALIERQISAGRAPMDHAALLPLRLSAELAPDGPARLRVWAPATPRAGQVDARWPLSLVRSYVCQVMALAEAAALNEGTEAWLRGPGGLGEQEANWVLAMLAQRP